MHVLLPTQSHEPISQFWLRACINQFPIPIGPYFLANQGNALLPKLNYNHATDVPISSASLFFGFLKLREINSTSSSILSSDLRKERDWTSMTGIVKNSHTPLQINTIMKAGHNGSRKVEAQIGSLFLSQAI